MSVFKVTPAPRSEIYIPPPDGVVEISPPAEATTAQKMALIAKIMMIGVPALMVTMMVIMFTSGTGTNPMYMMMMGVMMLSMLGGMVTRSVGDSGDVEKERRNSFLELEQKRPNAHGLGRAQHHAAVQNWPAPKALPSRADTGHASMWTAGASGEEEAGFVFDTKPKAGGSAGSLTADPYLTARVGTGLVPLDPPIKSKADKLPILESMEPVTLHNFAAFLATHNVVPNSPVALSLRAPSIGMRGDETQRMNLARTMILSGAGSHSPRDLHIGVVTKDPEEWDWLKWLPHCEDILADGPRVHHVWSSMREVTEHIVGARQYLEASGARFLVIVDLPDDAVYIAPDVANENPAAITQSGDDNALALKDTTFLVVRSASDDKMCPFNDRIHVSSEGMVSVPNRLDLARTDATTREDAAVIAERLGAYVPEGFRSLPSSEGVSESTVAETASQDMPDFLDVVLGSTTMDIEDFDVQAEWAKNDPGRDITTFLGQKVRDSNNAVTDALATINFLEAAKGGSGHSGLFSGGTGTGKSFTLAEMLAVLCLRYSPQRINFIGADFKGNSTFAPFRNLPHFVATISNLAGAKEEVFRFGDVLKGERSRREMLFDSNGVGDIYQYRDKRNSIIARGDDPGPGMPNLPDLFVVIDEFAEFAGENRAYVKLLEELGRVVRSLGMHLFLGSQRIGADIIGQDVVQHYQVGYSMYVSNPRDSEFVLHNDSGASRLPTTRYGRLVTDNGSGQYVYTNFLSHNHAKKYLAGSSAVLRPIDDVPAESDRSKSTETVAAADSGPASQFSLRGRYTDQRSRRLDGEDSADDVIVSKPKSRRDEIIASARLTQAELDALPSQLDALLAHIADSVGDYDRDIHRPWITPLSEPMTLAHVTREEWDAPADHGGPIIRMGDVDLPEQHMRVPMNLDLVKSGSVVVSGAQGSGTSTFIKTAVVSSAIRYSGRYLSWLICDGGTSLSSLETMPNVSAYAGSTDSDMWDRIIGEVNRIIDIRARAWQAGRYTSVEDYLARRAEDGVTGDPYGYLVLAVDEIDAMADAAEKAEDYDWLKKFDVIRNSAGYGIRFIATNQGMRHMRTHATLAKCTTQIMFPESQTNSYPITPSSNREQYRAALELVPHNQPGRILDATTMTEMGHTSYRQGLVMLPINEAVAPIRHRNGRPVYDTRRLPVDDIVREMGKHLSQRNPVNTHAPEVKAVDTNLPYSRVADAYSASAARRLEPRHRPVAIGMDCATGGLSFIDPRVSKHLAILGAGGAGSTTVLRTYMTAVAQAFDPSEAMVMCIDGGSGDLYEVSERLKATGHMTDTGYIRGRAASMEEPLARLHRILSDRLPGEDELGNTQDRDWFSGPEIFLFVDKADRLVSQSGMNPRPGTLEALAQVLTEHDDLGFHLIYTYRASEAAMDAGAKGRLMHTMIDVLQTPYLMLSAGADAMAIERRRFRREVPGRGRLVVPARDTESRIQVAKTT